MTVYYCHRWKRKSKQPSEEMLAHCKTFVLLNLIRLPEIQIEASVEYLRPCGNSYQGTWPLGLFHFIKQGVEVIEPGDREFVVRLIHYQIVNVAI